MAKQRQETGGTAVADPPAPTPPVTLESKPLTSLDSTPPPAAVSVPATPPAPLEQAKPAPTQAGLSPRPGLMVVYWENDGEGNPKGRPAILDEPTMNGWNMACLKRGQFSPRRGIVYSPVPLIGHWSFAPSS